MKQNVYVRRHLTSERRLTLWCATCGWTEDVPEPDAVAVTAAHERGHAPKDA